MYYCSYINSPQIITSSFLPYRRKYVLLLFTAGVKRGLLFTLWWVHRVVKNSPTRAANSPKSLLHTCIVPIMKYHVQITKNVFTITKFPVFHNINKWITNIITIPRQWPTVGKWNNFFYPIFEIYTHTFYNKHAKPFLDDKN